MSGNGWHGPQADDGGLEWTGKQLRSAFARQGLRLVGKPDNNRPAALVVTPGYPVVLALGDWCQLLNMAADTPMRSKLEGIPVEVTLGLPEVAAACTMLQADGTPWARMTQEAIAHKSHPSFMPPVDDTPPHGIVRPERGA